MAWHSLVIMTAKTWDVWLPFPAAEIEGLPDSFRYRVWDGEDDFPADPADCVFYVAPYMKPPRSPCARWPRCPPSRSSRP